MDEHTTDKQKSSGEQPGTAPGFSPDTLSSGGEIMGSWHSYPSVFNLGHRAIADLLAVPVNVEEKIDGSQFSFGLASDGELRIRSKGAVMHLDAPEKMFSRAVETVRDKRFLLTPGWTYRGEFLAKPKHNTLIYSRVPVGNIILFDINDGPESYLGYHRKAAEAERVGLECVPLLYSGMVDDIATFRALLDTVSILGGQKVEGVVIKPANYELFGSDKKVLMGKFVSEAFKEIHGNEWRKANPSAHDIIDQIALDLKTPARWNKAVQHLRECGEIEDSPRDIGKLIIEVQADVQKECIADIKEQLYRFAWPHIRRRVAAGLPEWYKDELLKRQFEATEPDQNE